MSISLVMIVKNEEKNISRVLHSVKDIVSEMIVVDTGSKDNTKEIAISEGAIVYDFLDFKDFSQVRNFAQEKAINDWVLIMDGDWELRRNSDLPIFDTKHTAYQIRWINQWEGEEVLSEQPRIVLYNKHFYKWVGVVHEYLQFSGAEENVGFLDWEIWHHFLDTPEKNLLYKSLVKNAFFNATTDLEKNHTLMFWVQQISKEGLWDEIANTIDKYLVKDCINHDAISIIEYWVVALQNTRKISQYYSEITDLLTKSNDSRVDLILADLNLYINKNLSREYYEKYISLTIPKNLLNLNWERYKVYPFIMLANLYQTSDTMIAKNYFKKAAEYTKILSKKSQILDLVNHI